MSLKLNSSGGGSVTLQEPTTASALTLSLPDVTGTVITTADSGTVTPTMLSQKLTLATAQNTTSGTAIDFTGIPSWVRRVTMIFNGVSLSGSAVPLIQLGTSGGVETTGYTGSSSSLFSGTNTASYTNGIGLNAGGSSVASSGSVVFTLISGNTWIAHGVLGRNDATTTTTGGTKTLSGTLDRIRLTTSTGTDTFDGGSVNIMYEG